MVFVLGQVAVALPHEIALSGFHGLRLDKADVDKDLDALLDCLFVNLLAGAVAGDLLEDSFCDIGALLSKNVLGKHRHALFADELELVILQVVSIEIVKGTLEHLREDAVSSPDLDEVCEKSDALVWLYQRGNFSLEIVCHKALENLVNLRVVIIRVALVHNELVNFHVLLVRGHSHRVAPEEDKELFDVVDVDKLLALLNWYILYHSGTHGWQKLVDTNYDY